MSHLKNLVGLEDGIIHYTQVGNQSRDIAWNTLSVIRLLAGGLSKVKLLVDYSGTGEMDEEARQSGFYAMNLPELTLGVSSGSN